MAESPRVRELGRPVVMAWLEHCAVNTLKPGDAADLMERVGTAIDAAQVPRVSASVAPLCAVHQRLEDANALECEIGNDCVACSLNERRELLGLIAPFAAEGNTEDSVTVLRRVAEFYQTHAGEGRVTVSYPALASPAAIRDENG